MKIIKYKQKDKIHTLLLVATLITTVTFSAGFTVPGGTDISEPCTSKATMLENKVLKTYKKKPALFRLKDEENRMPPRWMAHEGYLDGGLEHVKLMDDKEEGQTPPHLAIIRRRPRIVFDLVTDKRLDMTVVNNEGSTALDVAES
ncbi:PGG domain [Dillenia turbinata]|uniref:PGG domain n=1 Tax=Dillenia turbinata TaxID=194707 RepID=A0AAN8UXQ2_9MAGN